MDARVVVRLRVRVTPRGGRDAVEGYGADGIVHVRVAAAPADGKANDAVTRLVARAIAVPPTSVRIVAGAASRFKTIEVSGRTQSEVEAVLRSLGES